VAEEGSAGALKSWKFNERVYTAPGVGKDPTGMRNKLNKIITFTTSLVFLWGSLFSLSYAKDVQPTLLSKKEILIAKGDKKELEEKIEKELKEQEKELKELKEKKKIKS
jgi:hypothetical protein